MQKKQMTNAEIEAFKKACTVNGVKITKEPQDRIRTAAIKIGHHRVSFSKDLSVVRREKETKK